MKLFNIMILIALIFWTVIAIMGFLVSGDFFTYLRTTGFIIICVGYIVIIAGYTIGKKVLKDEWEFG